MRRAMVRCLVVVAQAALLALGCATAPPETSEAPRDPGGAAGPQAETPATTVGAEKGTAEKALAREILDATGVKGGLIVHLGCGTGELTAALRVSEAYLVHGLGHSSADVETARKRIRSLGLYGKVSVDLLAGKGLPYAGNLVNLVVSEDLGGVAMPEVMRVLAPEGVAYLKTGGEWRKTVKPRPEEIDEWTHYLHGPDGNPVAQDSVVGPPKRLQWVGSPRWARHHDHMASMTSLVSAGGRLFYIFDEGPTASIQLPEIWRLVARDAFNGTVLWKRPIDRWNTRHYPLKSGPAHLLRRLVAVGDRVYVTLGIDAPAAALDAATGETRLTYEDTRFTKEIVVSDGVVFLVTGKGPSKLPEWRRVSSYVWENTRRANPGWGWNLEPRRLIAHRADTGERLWEKEFPVAPCSLAVGGGSAVFFDGARLVCLDRATGETRWQGEPQKAPLPVQTNTGPRVVIYKDVVLFAGNNKLIVGYAAADGRKLWEATQRPTGHLSLKDLYVSGGLVWTASIAVTQHDGVFVGYDPRTGEKKREFAPDVHPHWFHHRCYPAKATEKYLITGRNGTEFVDTAKEHWTPNHWVRGGCIFGVMPCNGMTYAPMHSCGCQLEAKLCGFNALAPGPVAEPDAAALAGEARLERGPAYGKADGPEAAADDWPTYRRDPARSGATSAAAPGELGTVWSAKVGGPLSPPTVATGKLFVSEIDAHTLHAIDTGTGRAAWSYTAGARIDSPPTYHKGLVIFGSTDGRVYALRAADGELAWRFRAAPVDRRVVAWEQLESAWPVHGSVLVHGGVVYCLAGRSIFLDGGIRFLKLDAATGKLLGEVVMDETDPESGKDMHVYVKGMNMAVGLSDVLSFDGEHLYMRSQRIDLEGRRHEIAVADLADQGPSGQHMFCQIGFLDDSWFFRGFWTYGRRVSGGYGGWFQAGRLVPAGRILACDGSRVYGYGRTPAHMVNSSVLEHQLFAAEAAPDPDAIARVRGANGRMNARSTKKNASSSDWRVRRAFPVEDQTAARYRWTLEQPSVMGRALAVAGDTLFVAGPPALADERRAYRTPDDPEV
ncbi:MAG: outer membrane protein assembly factor BamB family protein, partial [Planctomycetota bacterium]